MNFQNGFFVFSVGEKGVSEYYAYPLGVISGYENLMKKEEEVYLTG